jgi:cephalosporin hydroxylase
LKWRGIPLGKTCWDISIYQQLIQELRPKTLIELGTGLGGSALFFLDHCRMFGLGTRIITLDVNIDDVSPEMFKERAIEFIAGDIKDLAELMPAQRLRDLPHPWLIVEDCHNEIELIVSHLQPLMASGDYLVIEDIGVSADGSAQIEAALRNVPKGTLMVDTFYTDLFGRNLTCSPDSIFRKT